MAYSGLRALRTTVEDVLARAGMGDRGSNHATPRDADRAAASSREAAAVHARPVASLKQRSQSPEHASANRAMFERIAPTYDVLNRLMTLGIDRRWRTRAVASLVRDAQTLGREFGPVLDLCAGTMDLSKMLEAALPHDAITACDFSATMLERGKAKVSRTRVVVGDALALPFGDGEFGAVICGFGVRNLADLRKGMREVRRVLRPNGVFVTLELFAPTHARTRALHAAALRQALPWLGTWVARDRDAYAYLAESMHGFVTLHEYQQMLREEGFEALLAEELTLGVASIVRATAAPLAGRTTAEPSQVKTSDSTAVTS